MDKFIWTQEYSVGIESIDEQHRHFFDIANKILGIMEAKSLLEKAIFEVLEELGDYAFYHLETEENYFDKFNYGGASEHIAVHNEYRGKVQDMMDRIRQGGDIKKIAKEAALYSGEWLFKHILAMDKKYTKFFQEKGVK